MVGAIALVEAKELYRSDTLLVRQVDAGEGKNWIITFDHHSIGAGFNRSGFGEEFLRDNGFSAIHVLGRGDDWYQYPDIFEATAAVRAATAQADRKITYGSSMGGYAAIRLANAVAADGVFALSPQWSINPRRAQWEKRWSQDAHRIDWIDAIDGPLKCNARPVLIYDPRMKLDVEHVTRIAAETVSLRIPVPYSGHPSSTFLGEISLLRPILEAVLEDRCDPKSIREAIRDRRSSSSVYLGALAEQQSHLRRRTSLSLARAAHAAKPESLLGMLSLARILARTNHYEEALALHRDIAIRTERMPLYLVPFADDLWLAGQRDEAISIGYEVVRTLPDAAHLRTWLAAMLAKSDAMPAAIEQQAVAVALTPGNRRYRRRLYAYRVERWKGWARRLVNLPGFASAPNRLRPIIKDHKKSIHAD